MNTGSIKIKIKIKSRTGSAPTPHILHPPVEPYQPSQGLIYWEILLFEPSHEP